MRLIDKEKFNERLDFLLYELNFYANKDMTGFNDERTRTIGTFFITHIHNMLNRTSEVDAIPVWYIIRWYEKRYKLGSTVADDWERGLLKEEIAEMHDDFKNEKYLDNKQESERFAQMVKEVIELYNDWEKENDKMS